MNYKHLFSFLSLILIFTSCEKDDPVIEEPLPEADYASGVIVLNEGNFGSANASVTFINEESGGSENMIFKSKNGSSLGDTAQSIELTDELAIIILNVSNKIEIVERYTFEKQGTISDHLQNPRYAEVINDKIYVTNWGDGMDPDDDFIAVFNLQDLTFVESISVPEGPETIVSANGTLYVAHLGGFSFNNIVSVIDTENNTLESEIEVGDLPNSMLVKGNELWVLSSGLPSYADLETAGSLSVINLSNNEVIQNFDFPNNTDHPANLSSDQNYFYFTINKEIYEFTSGTDLPEEPLISTVGPAVLYGFSIKDGKAYIASPNADFTGDGQVFVYDLSNKSLINQYPAGINPNAVYFN